jgi:hypothetical protein
MLNEVGTFVWNRGVQAQDRGERLAGRAEVDLLVEKRGRELSIWIDGFKVLQGPVAADSGSIGVGVAGGSATFENVRVRELK